MELLRQLGSDALVVLGPLALAAVVHALLRWAKTLEVVKRYNLEQLLDGVANTAVRYVEQKAKAAKANGFDTDNDYKLRGAMEKAKELLLEHNLLGVSEDVLAPHLEAAVNAMNESKPEN